MWWATATAQDYVGNFWFCRSGRSMQGSAGSVVFASSPGWTLEGVPSALLVRATPGGWGTAERGWRGLRTCRAERKAHPPQSLLA